MGLTGAYAILGVQPTAGIDDAKRAYRARAQLMHPDRVTSGLRADAEHAMAQLNEAWRLVHTDLARRTARAAPDAEGFPRSRADGQTSKVSPRPPLVGECDLCGWTPARSISLGSITGAVIVWTRRRGELELCRLCADGFYTETQTDCLTRGWWGLIAPVANLYTLFANWTAIRDHRRQVPWWQSRDANVITPLRAPMPFIPLRRRPAPFLATLAAAIIAFFILSGVVSDMSDTSGVASSDDAAGTCLTEGGRQISCDDSLAVFRLSGEVATPDLCAADAFQDNDTKKWFCAERIP